jgi:4-amino-4-deoxy-L-arabinose transferase-like glycosyltransferase
MFSPLVANYTIHLSLFCALLLATYGLVRRGVNRLTALLVALVVAWNPIIVSSVSWDYVDGFGIVFIVTTLWCLEQSARARDGWRWGGIASGITVAVMITTNLFLVTMMPVLALFFYLRAGVEHRHRVFAVTLLGAAGALVTFACLGAVSVALGQTFWFLQPQLRIAQTLTAARNPWQLTGYYWMASATWLVLPACAVIGAIVSCARWLRTKSALTFQVTMQVVFLVAVSLWVGIQVFSTPVLQISYYSSYLAPLALLALPLQATLPDGKAPLTLVLVAAATSMVFAAGHWLILSDVDRFWRVVEPVGVRRILSDVSWIGASHQQNCFAAAVGLIAGLAGVSAINGRAPALRRWMLFIACLTLSFSAAPQVWPSFRDATKARYELTIAAHRFIGEHIDGRKLRFWYRSLPEPMSPARSITSTYLWEYVLLNEDLPMLTSVQAGMLTPETRLVMLVAAVEDADVARVALRRVGFDYNVVANRHLTEGALSVSIILCDIVPFHEASATAARAEHVTFFSGGS